LSGLFSTDPPLLLTQIKQRRADQGREMRGITCCRLCAVLATLASAVVHWLPVRMGW